MCIRTYHCNVPKTSASTRATTDMSWLQKFLVRALLVLFAILEVMPHPQSYEHNHVRIHIPVYKHTKLHTRTVVKKVPIPVPVPVPIHHKEEHHTFHWPEKSFGRGSFYD